MLSGELCRDRLLLLAFLRLVRLVLALGHGAAVRVRREGMGYRALLALLALVVSREGVEAGKLLAAAFALERPHPVVQQHVPLAVVLASETDDALRAPFVYALVWSLVVVASEVSFEVEVSRECRPASRDRALEDAAVGSSALRGDLGGLAGDPHLGDLRLAVHVAGEVGSFRHLHVRVVGERTSLRRD